MVKIVYERMKINYVWANEDDFVFVKEGFLVEVSYVDSSLLVVLMSSPSGQRHMAHERMIWTMWNDMCNMLCILWKIISMMMHVTLMAWISKSKISKSTDLTFHNLYR